MGLNAILGGVSGVAGVLQGFGASRRAKEALEARDRIISQIGSDLDRQYQETQQGNLQALRRSTGLLGDSLVHNGADMGASLARGGVSNSTATAGAVAQNAANNGAQLQGLAQTNFNNEQNLLSRNQNRLSDLKLGYANQDVADAKNGANAAWGGVANLATGLGQMFTQNDQPKVGVTTNPLGMTGTTGGAIDPVQSGVQSFAKGVGAGVGSAAVQSASPANNGQVMNGNNNGAIPPLTLGQGPVGTTLNGRRRLF